MSSLTLKTPPTAIADYEVTKQLPTIEPDTLETRCMRSRRVCGLRARVQPEPGRIMLTADSTATAVTMDAQLAARVRQQLRQTGVRTGPICVHARSKRWSFLVVPDIPDNIAIYAELFRLSVSVARCGTPIALPAPTNRRIRDWVDPPTDHYKPSGMAVIHAVRTCTAAAHRRTVRTG
ncbi:DNA-directed RNA polymerase subunit beta [Nocardia asiatica]|uniref:DNA-directed RNA polymerase subunit beta n=1 Tax=Nocardia asiatica TaxID=209252 RepID=UPI0002F2FF24|nr:DNA-directed RNA polymerase subunit beta [Nocardia asiatica]